MKILVLGGDGYLGWPTALHLSERGHDVAVADNFARRQYDFELGVDSLVPIEPLQTRVSGLAGGDAASASGCYIGDLCDADFTYEMIARVPARRHRPLRRAARRAVLDDRPQARRLHPDQQRGRHPQRAVRDRRDRTRTSTWSSSARWASTARPTSTSRRAGSRSSTRAARTGSCTRSGRAPSTTCPRCTTATTSSSPAGSGACAPPTSTRASCTASRPRRPPGTTGWRPGSTTTPCSAPCSTGSSSRPCSASR